MEKDAKQPTVFDSDRQYLGDVYAKALLRVGKKSGRLDQLVQQLDSFVDLMNQLPKLQAILESPRVSTIEKERILSKVLDERADKDFANFIRVVSAKGRFDCLPVIRSCVHDLADEMAGRVKVTVSSAEALSDELIQNVRATLGRVLGKEIQLQTKVDPEIIGGLVIRVGDTVYDASIRNQLKRVGSAAIGRANQEIRQALDRFALQA
jgi:F-type H+-transporting ATPase subunit delta